MSQQFQCLSCGGVYSDSNPDGTIYAHVCGPLPPFGVGLLTQRPNKRDENPVIDGQGRAVGIKSPGDGVKPVTGTLPQPAWISAMEARIAALEAEDDA